MLSVNGPKNKDKILWQLTTQIYKIYCIYLYWLNLKIKKISFKYYSEDKI